MTAYIERIITEVDVQPEQRESQETVDSRWVDSQKVEAAIKRQQQIQYRTHAEGMDD